MTLPKTPLRSAGLVAVALLVASLGAPAKPDAVPSIALQAPLADFAASTLDAAADSRIGPGSLVSISFSAASAGADEVGPDFPSGPALRVPRGCTANWLWKDQDANLFLGTAGHCLLPDDAVATHGAGADYDADGVTVRACVGVCPVGGVLGLASANAPVGWVELGPVAYARQMDPPDAFGPDFGLVSLAGVDAALLDAALKGWGGPDATAASVAHGDLLLLHGNGIAVGETAATKSRAGVFLGPRADGLWVGNVPLAGGDSGSAVGRAVQVGGSVEAAGLLTHGLCDRLYVYGVEGHSLGLVPCLPADYVAGGTTAVKAQEMAREAGLCVEVVLAGEDLGDLEPAAGCLA